MPLALLYPVPSPALLAALRIVVVAVVVGRLVLLVIDAFTVAVLLESIHIRKTACIKQLGCVDLVAVGAFCRLFLKTGGGDCGWLGRTRQNVVWQTAATRRVKQLIEGSFLCGQGYRILTHHQVVMMMRNGGRGWMRGGK